MIAMKPSKPILSDTKPVQKYLTLIAENISSEKINDRLLHAVCLNVLKNTQNLFMKEERPSYSFILNYLINLSMQEQPTDDLVAGKVTLSRSYC